MGGSLMGQLDVPIRHGGGGGDLLKVVAVGAGALLLFGGAGTAAATARLAAAVMDFLYWVAGTIGAVVVAAVVVWAATRGAARNGDLPLLRPGRSRYAPTRPAWWRSGVSGRRYRRRLRRRRGLPWWPLSLPRCGRRSLTRSLSVSYAGRWNGELAQRIGSPGSQAEPRRTLPGSRRAGCPLPDPAG